MSPARDRRFISEYLLRQLTEDEQESFEKEYFVSPPAFHELLAVEGELIDAYLANRLSPDQRQLFERHYLESPTRKERIELERRLRHRALHSPPALIPRWLSDLESAEPASARESGPRSRSMARWWAAAASLAVVLVAGGWSVRRYVALRSELEHRRSDEATSQTRYATLQGELAKLHAHAEHLQQELALAQARLEALRRADDRRSAPAHRAASLTLLPGLSRAAEPKRTLLLGPGVDRIRLRLDPAGQVYARYSATLQTVDGDSLLTRESLRPARGFPGPLIDLWIDASLLRDGHYVITLRGIGPDGRRNSVADYSFLLLRGN